MQAGWCFSILYVNGMIMTMAAGGAKSDRRESRLMKDARRVAGRWLWFLSDEEAQHGKHARGGKEKLCEAEEPGAMFEVEHVAREEGVEPCVKVGIIPRDKTLSKAWYNNIDSYIQVILLHQREQRIKRQQPNRTALRI